MNESIANLTTVLGMRGSGKSHLTRVLYSRLHDCVIIFDRLRETKDGSHYVKNVDEFKRIWREVFHLPKFTIVINFPFGCSPEETVSTTSQIVEFVYRTGIETQKYTCLVFEEAQFYFPNHSIHPILFELLTTGRHAYIYVIANTQRPASISKLLISQSSIVYIGQLFEMRDIAYLLETVGEIAQTARTLEKYNFIRHEIGANTVIISP